MQLSIPLPAERHNHLLPALDSTVLHLPININFVLPLQQHKPSQRNLSGRAMSLGSAEFRDVGVGGHGQRRISEG